MRYKLIVMVILLEMTLSSSVLAEVKHAPLRAQCRADEALWYQPIFVPVQVPVQVAGKQLSEQRFAYEQTIKEIDFMKEEMMACFTVYDDGDAFGLNFLLDGEIKTRMDSYLLRHDLWSEWLKAWGVAQKGLIKTVKDSDATAHKTKSDQEIEAWTWQWYSFIEDRFLMGKHLMEDFLKEDKAGKR